MSERELFIAALQKENLAERQAYLDAECVDRPELREQVQGLLRLYEDAGSFLQKPAAAGDATYAFVPTTATHACEETPGTLIGPYKLLQQIGEGGMGTVFMAEQTQPIHRKVALKVIKAGMDSRQVIARFEAERQALAMMDHVNIARVLDAGTIPLRIADCGLKMPPLPIRNPQSAFRNPKAAPTSSWSWSTVCRSPSTATTTA